MKNKIPAFSITIDNTVVGGTSSSYVIFDADGINTAIGGAKWTESKALFVANSSGSINPEIISETTKTSPIKIVGFNYQVENASDFSNNFDFYKADIDGRQRKIPNVIQKARRNNQFDSTLLTIDEQIIIDSKTALFLNVTNSTKVTLTFFVEELI